MESGSKLCPLPAALVDAESVVDAGAVVDAEAVADVGAVVIVLMGAVCWMIVLEDGSADRVGICVADEINLVELVTRLLADVMLAGVIPVDMPVAGDVELLLPWPGKVRVGRSKPAIAHCCLSSLNRIE